MKKQGAAYSSNRKSPPEASSLIHFGSGVRVRRWQTLLCVVMLIAVGLGSGMAQTADPAVARHTGSTYELGNHSIEAVLIYHGGHIAGLKIKDELNARQINLPEEFTISLRDGTTLRATEMALEGSPSIEDLEIIPGASRLAEHFGGKRICADLKGGSAAVRWCAVLRDGSRYLRQVVEVHALDKPLAIQRVQLIDLTDPGAHVSGSVKGSPVVDATMYFGFEHPLSTSSVISGKVTAFMQRVLPLQAGHGIAYSSVVGVSEPGQMRRGFLAYLQRERAHPYRTFLHYNTWYDLGFDNRYDEAGVLDRIHAFGDELVRKRNVVLDSFMLDDGWDNPDSLWKFNSGFPDGLTRVHEAAAQYHFGIGVWLSPWGGYDATKLERIAYGRAHGYEIVKGGYALSGPRYYRQFEQTCLGMIEKYGVNQFKLDGTGNASQVVPGSAFDSDFSAAIHLIGRLRQQESGIFINLTTGTYPSPFWLRYADSIWRGGDDHSFAGVGTWRQKWITYRDAQTYKNIVQAGPLFPLNSLMLHGIIYAKQAEHLSTDPGRDFSAEVRSYFGTGTQLQELYITPSLLSKADWDVLAQCAKWSRANAQVLRDTHWIGGDPAALQVYGWAAWTPQKGIIVLRNPSAHVERYSLDAGKAFELPARAGRHYRVKTPWPVGAQSAPATLSAGVARQITLAPFQVLTLEAYPEPRM